MLTKLRHTNLVNYNYSELGITAGLEACEENSHSKSVTNFDVLLNVHLSITLVTDQLETQFFYFIIRLLQSSTCFEQSRAHHEEVKLY